MYQSAKYCIYCVCVCHSSPPLTPSKFILKIKVCMIHKHLEFVTDLSIYDRLLHKIDEVQFHIQNYETITLYIVYTDQFLHI